MLSRTWELQGTSFDMSHSLIHSTFRAPSIYFMFRISLLCILLLLTAIRIAYDPLYRGALCSALWSRYFVYLACSKSGPTPKHQPQKVRWRRRVSTVT